MTSLSKICLVLTASVLLSACSSLQHYSKVYEQEQKLAAQAEQMPKVEKRDSMHQHAMRVAHQLYGSITDFRPEAKIAVGSFLMVDSLKQPMSKTSPTYMYGLQMAESLATVSVQLGLSVVEFKALPAIQITESHDRMLSRDLALIDSKQNIDYFLTGTLLEQEDSLVVNAKIIEVGTNIVKAAATDVIPADIIWQKRKVIMNNGVISRTSY